MSYLSKLLPKKVEFERLWLVHDDATKVAQCPHRHMFYGFILSRYLIGVFRCADGWKRSPK